MRHNKLHIRVLSILLLILLCSTCILSSCSLPPVPEPAETEAPEITEESETATEDDAEDLEAEEPTIDTENTPLYEMVEEDLSYEERANGEVKFESERALTYGRKVHCLFDLPTQQLIFQCCFNQIPASDDDAIYLFSFETYENSEDLSSKEPFIYTQKGHTMQFCMDYNRTYLFKRFVPALKVNGDYVAISTARYMTNPEILAPNQAEAPVINSKKGLLIDPATVNTEKLTDLNIQRGIYNMPLSQILGESSNPDMPTTEYVYKDVTYYFNTATLYAYDGLFTYLNEVGIYPTTIILNDWNEAYPDLIHPLSRTQTGDSLYYAFNTEDQAGVELMEATALFLAERYSTGWYGMVYEWVIANEINQQTSWNYMDTDDLDYYTTSFEHAFRIFYNAIKSQYASAEVYFSLDHDWNDNKGKNSKWFNGKEVLQKFNTLALQGGNYDWSLAIHPYPNPLTRVNFWTGNYDMSEDASLLTIMNLSTVTSILQKGNFLNNKGEVRNIAITELGFTSDSGEKLQAAAFAYCYYIIESNPYIDSFMMNRQTDAYEEMKNGLSFGIYNPDLTEKYIYNVFKYIDSTDRQTAQEYMDFMLNILKVDSLEEALSWAIPEEIETETADYEYK